MRKLFHLIIVCMLIISIYGCSALKTNVNDATDLVFSADTGVLLMAALIEMNTNFSSLIYDKTKAKFKDYSFVANKKIELKKRFFVIPPKNYLGEYDFETKRLVENVIVLNKLGEVTQEAELADYVIILNFDESITKVFGENFIREEITVFDKNDAIVSHMAVTVLSKSDSNFFYFPGKAARPVSYLKIKGLEYLIDKTFPKVFDMKKGGKDA
ncbi:hypothetical protein LF845_00170 [Deferribacterales bacterium Es71-Z0220]|uniref:hypothetical protein n=1 Tax=Deferrivibrio essentukiensis TaxID=2880922 RepID=UPI001F611560|nr:hypothetical protein [Deferrivibrio essentukiensis]MCB4203369.1 hypothetical protein [Deferrivibrio essentukiensis]